LGKAARRRFRILLTGGVTLLFAAGCGEESYGTAEIATPGQRVLVLAEDTDTAWLGMPAGFAVTDREILIGDVFRHSVHRVDRVSGNRTLLASEGVGPGEFQAPHLAAMMDGEIWVTDTGTHRLTRLTPEGQLLATAALRVPLTVAVDDRGRPVTQGADPGYLVEVIDSAGPHLLGELSTLPGPLAEHSYEARLQPNYVHLEPLPDGRFVVAENETGTVWIGSISNAELSLTPIALPARLLRELREFKTQIDESIRGGWVPIYQSVHACDSNRVWLRTTSTKFWGALVNIGSGEVETLVQVDPDETIPMMDSLVRGDTLFILTDTGVEGRLLDVGE
jgi:hypothetical protein